MYISKNNRVVIFSSEQELEDALNNGTFSPPWGAKCKGGKFIWAAESPAGEFISEEAQAVLDRMSGLTATERQAIINFVNQEAADGNWALVDEFFAFGLNGTNALTGFISKTATNNGGVLSVEGATFAGAEHIDSNWNPTNDAVNYTLDEPLIGSFVVENLSVGQNVGILSAQSTVGSELRQNNNIIFRLNGSFFATTDEVAFANASLYVTEKLTGTGNLLYKNGARLGVSGGPPATLMPNATFKIGHETPYQFTGTLATAVMGGEGFDQAAHYTNLLNFLIELGTFSQPVIDSFPQPLAVGESDLIADFINAEVRAGNWGKYDSFVHFGLTDPANALWDWKRKVSMTNNGAVHSAGVGYVFVEGNSINANLDLSTLGGNYKLDDALMGLFFNVASMPSGSNKSVINNSIFRQQGGPIVQYRINQQASWNFVTSDFYKDNTLYIGTRTGATAEEAFVNGISVQNGSAPSVAIPTSVTLGNLITGTVSSFIAGAAIGFGQLGHYNNLVALNAGLAP